MAIGYLKRRGERKALEAGLRRQFRADLARLLREQPELLATAAGRREVSIGVGCPRLTRATAAFAANGSGGEDGAGRVARAGGLNEGSRDAEAAARALEAAADVARARAGTVLDSTSELLVLWNAPFDQRDHPVRACRNALEAVSAARKASSGRVEIAFGLASGAVSLTVAGQGYETRYVAVGSPLDVAAELARCAGAIGVGVLAAEETITAARGALLAREIDMIAVEIERERFRVFEVLGDAGEFERYAARFEHYGAGLTAYRARNWAEAHRRFEQALRACPDDGPAAVMSARCKRLECDPPGPEWTPVTVIRDLR